MRNWSSLKFVVLPWLALMPLTGCAQNGGDGLLPQVGQISPDTYRAGGVYTLNAEELALDCKRLTGRMQVRILQARDASVRSSGSALARGTQAVVTPVFGGPNQGTDLAFDATRDRAYLEAMNKQLGAKNCATYDLEAEMRPRSIRDTPTPVPKGNAAKAQ
jgi:hypothetical protein